MLERIYKNKGGGNGADLRRQTCGFEITCKRSCRAVEVENCRIEDTSEKIRNKKEGRRQRGQSPEKLGEMQEL